MDSLIALVLFTGGLSLLFNTLLRKINVETIIGYIFAGTVVAYIFDLQNTQSDLLNIIAEFGIAFLMFTIGLEVSLEKLKTIKKEVFLYGGAQVLITGLLFFVICRYGFDIRLNASVIISLGLALSSTAIVLKLLNESKTLHKTYGKNALGVLLFQDMAVIPILLLISILANTQSSGGEIFLDISYNAVFVMLAFFFVGSIANPFFNFISNAKSDEVFIGSILFVVIGAAQIAHVFGFSYSLGAFVGGLIIAGTQYKHQIEADLIPFRDLLLGVFFTTVGMQLDLRFIPDYIGTILLILGGVILIKTIVIYGIMRVGYGKYTSLKTSIILAQVGEFSFAVFELARINNLFVNETLGQMIIIAIVFSMILTPFIFNKIADISGWFVTEEEDNEDEILQEIDLEGHIIICGYGALGKLVVQKIIKLNIPYLVIERDNGLVNSGREKGVNIILGNSAKKKILEKVNIEKAKCVFIAVPHEEKMIRIVETIRSIAPNVQIIARAISLYQRDFLESMGNVYVIDEVRDTVDSAVRYFKKHS